jgi:heme-degrading monooxygenase HmoA
LRKTARVICVVGIWTAKEGREDEFARRWEESCDSLVLEYPDLRFRLLRDQDGPRRFVSLTEGWRTLEQIDEVRNLPSYLDSMSALWRVLESGEQSTFELAVEIS